MYARILVAVDDSRGSTRAVAHAIALTKAFGAKLKVLHVVDMGWLVLGSELAVDTEQMTDARREQGAKTVALALEQAHAAGVETESCLIETEAPNQRVAEKIVAEAAGWPADLLVLGTHGRTGAERWMLGSVAEGVARRSAVPVLLVHE